MKYLNSRSELSRCQLWSLPSRRYLPEVSSEKSGKGYQTPTNEVLKAHINSSGGVLTPELVRKIVREELASH